MLEYAKTPEEVGVNSGAVLDLLGLIEKGGLKNHSMVIIRDGKIAVEKYTAPYSADYAHSMFSVSKGFVALAIGYLLDEGKIPSVDTPILDLLPEFAEYKKDERYEKITVKALLTMHSGKKCSFIRHMARGDYAEFFMKAPFKKKVEFVYSNDDVYMLAKTVNVLTGQTVVDYLMPRLFEPLGIDRPFWELTQMGIEAGATGLYLKTMDLAKVCLCYLQGGFWENKQVIPKWWAENAGKYYVKLPDYYLSCKDYGFYFWGDPAGGYRFDGMFGQFGIVLPKYNAVIAMTNCGNREKQVLEDIFAAYLKLFSASDGSRAEELKKFIDSNKRFDVPVGQRRTDMEKKIGGKTLRLTSFGFIASCFKIYGHPQSMMPMAIKAAFPKIPWQHYNDFKLNFNKDTVDITWTEDKDTNTVTCGMDGNARKGEMTLATYKFKTLGYAYWKDEKTFVAEIRPIETVGYKTLTFTFDGDKFTLYPESFPRFDEWAKGHMDEVDNIPAWMARIEEKAVDAILKRTHPTFRGKIRH